MGRTVCLGTGVNCVRGLVDDSGILENQSLDGDWHRVAHSYDRFRLGVDNIFPNSAN